MCVVGTSYSVTLTKTSQTVYPTEKNLSAVMFVHRRKYILNSRDLILVVSDLTGIILILYVCLLTGSLQKKKSIYQSEVVASVPSPVSDALESD